MKTETKNIEIELSKPQLQFLSAQAKFRAFIAGRGAGKTTVGIFAAIMEAIKQPGSIGRIVAPSYPLINDAIKPLFFELIPPEYIASDRRHDITLVNGSVIQFRSAPDLRHIERLRGASIAWFWLDEASLSPRLLWDVLLGCLRQPHYRLRAWATATPKPHSWLKQVFVDHPADDSFVLVNIPSRSNPFLPDGYLESLEQQYSGLFAQQELEGRFVEFQNRVYPAFNDSHIITKLPDSFSNRRMIYGVDWGFTSPACMLAIAIIDSQPFVIAEFFAARQPLSKLITVAQRWVRDYGPGTFFCDPSQPDHIERFRETGIDARRAKNALVPGIMSVTSYIEHPEKPLRVLATCQNLIAELFSYSYREGSDEVIKQDDHAVDALRYALHSFRPARATFHTKLLKD